MKKISTLFKKDPADLGRVINEVNPENDWVFTNSVATRKFDGTAMAVINGELYKRYDVKKGRPIPENGIACQEPDAITGHWPHWVPVNPSDKADQYAIEAWEFAERSLPDRTYELVGPKVQGNPENFLQHTLIPHGQHLLNTGDLTFANLHDFLRDADIEGIVFHATDGTGRMCKLRKSDFGIKR